MEPSEGISAFAPAGGVKSILVMLPEGEGAAPENGV